MDQELTSHFSTHCKYFM